MASATEHKETETEEDIRFNKRQKLMMTMVTLAELFAEGVPRIMFVKENSPRSNHASNHEPVRMEETSKVFNTLDNLFDDWCCTPELAHCRASFFRNHMIFAEDPVILSYGNETEIQAFVRTLLEDVLILANLSHKLNVKQQVSLPQVRYLGRGSHKSDFRLICTPTGRPILVIEVKSPHNTTVLQDPQVVGQIVDYMLDTVSFFGQQHVFGITTTLAGWKIHWFPHSDEVAQATTTEHDEPTLSPTHAVLVADRVVFSTDVIDHTDPTLVPKLLSALHKCYHSPYQHVNLIDPDRMYLKMTHDSWQWTKLSEQECQVAALSLNLTTKSAKSSSYTAVKYFLRDHEKDVWLAIAHPSSELVVIKMCESDAAASVEVEHWKTINSAFQVYHTTVRSKAAVCMPLVIHAENNSYTRKVTFNFQLSAWFSQAGAAPGALPAHLQALSDTIQQLGAALDPREVARAAIEKAALRRVVHEDLEWRHIALMPVFDKHGALDKLEPVLIDFGMVSTLNCADECREAMIIYLNSLVSSCVWDT